jgi:hypothetical protein
MCSIMLAEQEGELKREKFVNETFGLTNYEK